MTTNSKTAATLARIEQKLDDMKEVMSSDIIAFKAHVAEDREEFKSVRNSILSLRLWQRWVVGVSSGVGFLLGLLGVKDLR